MEDDALDRELQQHLDRMPVPYPASESGVGIRILKQLFKLELILASTIRQCEL